MRNSLNTPLIETSKLTDTIRDWLPFLKEKRREQTRNELKPIQLEGEKMQKILKDIEDFRATGGKYAYTDIHDKKTSEHIIDPEFTHAWISDGQGVPRKIKIPTTLEEGQTITRKDETGEKYTVTERVSNGYNSEYQIQGDRGSSIVIGIIYTTQSPEYRLHDERIKTIKEKMEEYRESLRQSLGTLKVVESSIPQSRGKKRKGLKQQKSILQKEIRDIRSMLGNLESAKLSSERLRDKTTRYISFPYTPYSRELHTTGMQVAGMRHLGEVMNDALDTIRKNGAITITETGGVMRTVNISDIHTKVPLELVLLLNIIERMGFLEYTTWHAELDRTMTKEVYEIPGSKKTKKITERIPDEYTFKDSPTIEKIMKQQAEQSLVTFGLNREHAFRWQRSKPGALGIAQIMPNTYTNLRNKYSNLRNSEIPAEHEKGAKDQRVSLQFQIMHLYDQYYSLPRWIRDDWENIMKDPKASIGLMSILAGGYNGSMSRIVKESGISTEGIHTLTELYPENLREKFKGNLQTYTYIMKLEFLMKEYMGRK